MVSSWAHLPWITDVDSSFLLAPNTYKRTRFNRLARVDGHKGPSWVLWAGTTSMQTDVQAATTSPLSESRPPSPLPFPPPASLCTHAPVLLDGRPDLGHPGAGGVDDLHALLVQQLHLLHSPTRQHDNHKRGIFLKA